MYRAVHVLTYPSTYLLYFLAILLLSFDFPSETYTNIYAIPTQSGAGIDITLPTRTTRVPSTGTASTAVLMSRRRWRRVASTCTYTMS